MYKGHICSVAYLFCFMVVALASCKRGKRQGKSAATIITIVVGSAVRQNIINAILTKLFENFPCVLSRLQKSWRIIATKTTKIPSISSSSAVVKKGLFPLSNRQFQSPKGQFSLVFAPCLYRTWKEKKWAKWGPHKNEYLSEWMGLCQLILCSTLWQFDFLQETPSFLLHTQSEESSTRCNIFSS